MKLGISNLAWAPEADAGARDLLPGLGVHGIEVALTRIAAWDTLTPARLAAYRRAWSDAGLAMSSLQAIFFDRPEAQLLGDAAGFEAMAEHLRAVAAHAAILGAGVAVFGAPRNRTRGPRPLPEAEALAAERLHALGDIAARGNLVLGIEPVPAPYGSDFMQHAADMLRVVAACAHPNVRPHLDTACVGLAGDDIAAAIADAGPALAHYHAAEPGLRRFDAPAPAHATAAAALALTGYDGWVVIEMRQQDDDGLAAVAEAARFAAATYARVGTA